MKKLFAVLLLVSLNAFAGSEDIHLRADESVEIVCSEGLSPEKLSNMVSCACPEARKMGYGEQSFCAPGCIIGMQARGYETYFVALGRRNEMLFEAKIYSTQSREKEYYLPKAIAKAKQHCSEIYYDGRRVE